MWKSIFKSLGVILIIGLVIATSGHIVNGCTGLAENVRTSLRRERVCRFRAVKKGYTLQGAILLCEQSPELVQHCLAKKCKETKVLTP